MPFAAELAAVLFIATALLCLYAEGSRRPLRQRIAMVMALITVTAADAAMLSHDPKLGLSWPTFERASSVRRKVVRDHDGSAGGGGEASATTSGRGTAGNGNASGEHDGDGDGEDIEEEVVASGLSWSRLLLADLFSARSQDVGAAHSRQAGDTFRDCAICPEMVVVPAGDAVIGAVPTDREATVAEQPQRRVRIWPGFAIARFETTVAELRHGGSGDRRCQAGDDSASNAPATCLSWADASAYAAWLAAVTGHRYRLPSAAEWEYAARLAGAPRQVASADPTGLSIGAWPEAMGGGVAELVADCWADTLENASENASAFRPNRVCWHRILKDGAGNEDRRWQRPSARRPVEPLAVSPRIGFRVVRDMAHSAAAGP